METVVIVGKLIIINWIFLFVYTALLYIIASFPIFFLLVRHQVRVADALPGCREDHEHHAGQEP
jgi:hypothetical protein